MEHYNIMLPIYGEVSTNFKKFVTEVTNLNCLRKYLVQFSNGRLWFLPSVDTEGEVKLRKSSIDARVLIRNGDSDLKKIKDFGSRFNMLATVAMSSKLGGSTTFDIKLMEVFEYYMKSQYVLEVSLKTDDMVVILSVSNLFKALSD